MQDNSVECFRRACKIFSLDSEQVMCSMHDLLPIMHTICMLYDEHAIFSYVFVQLQILPVFFGSVVAHLGYFWENHLVFRK